MGEKSLLKFNVQYVTIFGLFPPSTSNYFVLKLYHIYKVFNLFLLYIVWLPFLYELSLGEKSKITDYTLTIMNTGAYLCSILTLHFFIKKGNVGLKLVEELNDIFKYKSDSGITETNMAQTDKNTKKITIYFSSLLSAGVLSMALLPLAMKGRILPLPGVYPGMDPKNSTLNYVEMYVLQGVAQVVLGHVTAGSDTLFICMVLLASQQLKVLATDFHNCLYNVLLEHGVSKEKIVEFKNNMDTPNKLQGLRSIQTADPLTEDSYMISIMQSCEFKAKLMRQLIKYINHHQELLNFCGKLDRYFLPLVFMKVCVSMFYHVFITFALLHSADMGLAITLVQYEICAVAELFTFCLAGQILINESEGLHKQLLESPWYVCDIYYQKHILMILMRTSRHNEVSIGKFSNMSLPTFLLIMKTALSYLAVLRQVTDA